MEERIKIMLSAKDVGCTLRKQPRPLTDFFYARLREYSLIVVHPDAGAEPRLALLNRLYTVLKFIGKPNDVWRKQDLIGTVWPALETDLKQVL